MNVSLYTSVTGMLAHQRRIDVIANNIANVNTTGYRKSRMQFQELFAETIQGARGPDGDVTGGTNPLQVGRGVSIGAIDTIFTQAPVVTTGAKTDLAIEREGFFVLRDDTGLSYTRAGAFSLNPDGALIEPATGQFVQGYIADEDGVIDYNQPVQDIVLPVGGQVLVRETSQINLTGNLNAASLEGQTVVRNVQIYDGMGSTRTLTLTFEKTAVKNEWEWQVTTDDPDIDTVNVVGDNTITFTDRGTIDTGEIGTVQINFDPAAPAAPVDPLQFTINMNDVGQLASESDVAIFSQDGYPPGRLDSYEFGGDGLIVGIFTNGLTMVLGQVALAKFSNNGGLAREGNTQFRETPASGLAQIGAPNTGGRGSISSGVLEGANVDIGTEFSDLIISQRGFQANARGFTVSDNVLQEAVNLIR